MLPSRRKRSLLVCLCVSSGAMAVVAAGPEWVTIGHDAANTRSADSSISVANVSRLKPKWVATTAGDVSATPAVAGGAVYFGDFGGTLWKLDAKTGAVIWSHSVADYTGIAGDFARTSPSLWGDTLDTLIVGDIRHPNLLGIDSASGKLRWNTQVHPDARAVMTGSPTIVKGVVYTGVSAQSAGGRGATLRGAIAAVDAQTGHILWQHYSLPENSGYAGATMFCPPTVSEESGLVYGTFGQPYTEPAAVTSCYASHGGFAESCVPSGAYFRSVVAFDLKTGEPRWSYRMQGHDPWVRACGGQPASVTWCAAESDAEKWDFGGSGVNIMRVRVNRAMREVAGVGSKSGVYLLLDAKTGEFLWNTLLGPGGDQGGMEWGTAFDGTRIYAAITNQHHIPYQLTQNGKLTDATVTGGSWAALDPSTGKILWQTADPQTETLAGSEVGVWDLAPVTIANGVLYAASMAKRPEQNQMFALNAATGAILWQFSAGSSVNAGPAVVGDTVYWGSGYSRSGAEGSGNTKMFAFTVDGK